MTNLKKSYDEYRSKGFILNEAMKLKKFCAREGSYRERENEPFNESATGYVAIIPEGIIIVDNDSYVDGNEFEKFISDLAYEPVPFAKTPSGGEHYAFKNNWPDLVCGKSAYKGVDIFAGYQSVIPIVGTKVKNKQGEIDSYKWHEDNFEEEIILNEIPKGKEVIFNLIERNSGKGAYDKEMDDLDLAVELQEREKYMPTDEVEAIIDLLPENMHYDDWLRIGMALYDRFMGNDDGKKLWHRFSERSFEKYDYDYTENKWSRSHLYGKNISYRSLPFLAVSFSLHGYAGWVKRRIKSLDDIETIEIYRNRAKLLCDLEDSEIDEIAKGLNLAYKRVKADMVGRQARTIKKEIKKGVKKQVESDENIEVYRLVNKYIVKAGGKIIEGLSSTMLKEVIGSLGYHIHDSEEMAEFKKSIPNISKYVQEPDYLQQDRYRIELVEQDDEKFPVLTLKTNPIKPVDTEIDPAIVDEFFDNVWAGKLVDIVKLIALSIKTGESKLNRLMVVAPSNSGKTEIFSLMGFQKITMQRLLLAMRAEKGVGKPVVEGIRKTGLLLIDEANKALEAEIKDMDKYLYIDQFGVDGGTQILKLHFTALTSTHFTATRNNSDELYNRFLQVELKAGEMKHTVTEGIEFRKDSKHYTDVVQAKLQQLFIEFLTNHEGKEELRELQEKYRLPINNDLEELLYEISTDFITDTKQQAKAHGDIVKWRDSYFYKRKGDVRAYFEARLKEIHGLDVGKYSDILMSHFIKDSKGRSIKVDGKSMKYYEINMTSFYASEEDEIMDMFDELDEF